ncbi:hypothetical protein Scep_014512 [Stephania cephalantha]|uniref:Uncharacterized protein n=1 Tax=Stephania cephalantha TaxID=152367 RepID=A0AAP0P332_9MAGN
MDPVAPSAVSLIGTSPSRFLFSSSSSLFLLLPLRPCVKYTSPPSRRRHSSIRTSDQSDKAIALFTAPTSKSRHRRHRAVAGVAAAPPPRHRRCRRYCHRRASAGVVEPLPALSSAPLLRRRPCHPCRCWLRLLAARAGATPALPRHRDPCCCSTASSPLAVVVADPVAPLPASCCVDRYSSSATVLGLAGRVTTSLRSSPLLAVTASCCCCPPPPSPSPLDCVVLGRWIATSLRVLPSLAAADRPLLPASPLAVVVADPVAPLLVLAGASPSRFLFSSSSSLFLLLPLRPCV